MSSLCTDVSDSVDLLVAIGICCACTVSEDSALSCVTDNVTAEVFCIFGKILLLKVSHHFYSNTLQ